MNIEIERIGPGINCIDLIHYARGVFAWPRVVTGAATRDLETDLHAITGAI